jgi:hypothetical protein
MAWLKGYLSEEKEKIVGLPTAREKAEYIWTYYKLWIIGAVALVWFVSFAVWRFFFVPRDNWFFAVFANTYSEQGAEGSELWQDFVDYAGYNPEEKKVAFNNSIFFDLTQGSSFTSSYYQSFVAFEESGDLDIVTMERRQLAALGATGRLLDLNNPECAALRERYADRLVYTEANDEEYSVEPVPVGIDVSDSLLMTKYHLYGGENCVLGIGAHTAHLDQVENFLSFIFQEE